MQESYFLKLQKGEILLKHQMHQLSCTKNKKSGNSVKGDTQSCSNLVKFVSTGFATLSFQKHFPSNFALVLLPAVAVSVSVFPGRNSSQCFSIHLNGLGMSP